MTGHSPLFDTHEIAGPNILDGWNYDAEKNEYSRKFGKYKATISQPVSPGTWHAQIHSCGLHAGCAGHGLDYSAEWIERHAVQHIEFGARCRGAAT